jgi:hypothetical protein
MEFEVIWKIIKNRSNSKWHFRHCLYAIIHPTNYKILYIGKAWQRTVKQRFHDDDKNSLYDFLSSELNLDNFLFMVGDILTDVPRFTDEMLSDIESLLIKRIQPPGNIQSKRTRISRPEMIVTCTGDWPKSPQRFIDRG